MADNATDFVPCMIIPLQHHYLLLPNSTLAEVIPLPRIIHTDNAKPSYWIGQCDWQAQTIPIIDLESLVENKPSNTTDAGKLCVLRGINTSANISIYGLPCHGVPQLIHLTESALKLAENAIESDYVHYQIQVGNRIAYIPNLDAIETMLSKQQP
ncbi:MAG: chemosensory pili system protein ChpC [Methylophagaceae bacterium]|jgi:chemosensory pili system protein ChpC